VGQKAGPSSCFVECAPPPAFVDSGRGGLRRSATICSSSTPVEKDRGHVEVPVETLASPHLVRQTLHLCMMPSYAPMDPTSGYCVRRR
jgi:hypothetical protein